MPQRSHAVFNTAGTSIQRHIAVLCLGLLAFNAAAWLMAFVLFRGYPMLIGTSLLAYSFGLRHAVDADHIAAIDNVTRKLVAYGKRPLYVGLMFSLGHSTIVILASAFVALTATTLDHLFSRLITAGAVFGTAISAIFLFVIAFVNLVVLRSGVTMLRRVRAGEPHIKEHTERLFDGQGLLARLFRPLFHLVTKSWHMYFLGFLFGLGFDTATEVGILGISAAGSSHGLPVWSILIFPLLFTSGMALVDTGDSILMQGAYGWARIDPIRKLSYNIFITGLSSAVAMIVGSVEALGLLADNLNLSSGLWEHVARLNQNSEIIGYAIVAIFVLTWVGWSALARWKRHAPGRDTESVIQ